MSSSTTNSVFRVSGEVMAKFCQIPDLCRKVQFAQISDLARPVEFPTVITHQSLTIRSHIMDHRKAERVAYRNGIHNLWSFGQSEAQKFSFVQSLFCPRTEFSSEVDLQNSVTPKPFFR
jgi:hypothetical protein